MNWTTAEENFMLANLGGLDEVTQMKVNHFAARRKLSPGAAAFILLSEVVKPSGNKGREIPGYGYPFIFHERVVQPKTLLTLGKEVA